MLTYSTHDAPANCIFIHGAGGNELIWRRTLQFLNGPHEARSINLPGHPSGQITCRSIGEYAEAVHTFLSDNRLSEIPICGHSMGSAVALVLTLEHPDDVSSLILVGSGAKLGVDPTIVKGLEADAMKTIEQLITPRSFAAPNLELGREGRAALSFTNLPVFLNDYLACNDFDVRDRLQGVKVPTLILCGEQDVMTPPKWAHYLHGSISDSEAYFIRGSGHMVPLEKPQQAAALISYFLKRLNP